MIDYYTILGVPNTASDAEIKAAYRQLAAELHPDTLPDTVSERMRSLAAAEFQRLQEAYRILGNPVSRTAYDAGQRPLSLQSLPPADGWDLVEVPTASFSPWFWRLGGALALTASLVFGVQRLWLSSTPQVNSDLPEVVDSQSYTLPQGLDNDTTSAEDITPESSRFSTGEITRFTAAAIAMRPLVADTDAALETASADEASVINAEFEAAAVAILQEHGLSAELYQSITAEVRANPVLQRQVSQMASRLLENP